MPAATDADAAEEMLGWAVAVVLDGGTSHGASASTIVDCTGARPRLLREGAIAPRGARRVLAGLGTFLEEPDRGARRGAQADGGRPPGA